ncbi:hypothetical protein B0H17DRAFT_1024312 [Mycena rosella]|uniref:Uncharacterized protein n=1 Tax=Mycena rosella TaxID=1033263 RepID=A0AAD7FM00_MYCRO|nr:hypothetical protein B0H17DRAFT_1024312 [Mycena rosella]
MSLQHYHRTCSRYLSTPRGFFISTYTSLKLGTVYQNLRPNYESLVEVAFVSDLDFTDLGWENPNGTVPGQIMEDGWTRIPSAEVDHKYSCSIYAGDVAEWLSQANHIFKCLNITSNYEQYAVVDYVGYRLTFSGPNGLPPGYLFLCPLKYFHSHDPTCFPYPDFPAYWSLDPTGIERLSTEEATDLGFPSFEFKMMVIGFSWDSSAYDGLRAFHEAKGFDPYSQDVARHLGYPLYELSGVEGSFAHCESHRTPGLIMLTEQNSGRDQ